MRALLRNAILSALLVPSLHATAVEVHDFDLEHEIPRVNIVGPETPAYVEAAEALRARLIDNLAYWQKRGLPDPPDLKRIFIFSDPKDLTVLEILTALNPDKIDEAGTSSLHDHLKQQHAALRNSQLVKLLEKFRRSNEALRERIDFDGLLDLVFDNFCFLRYGYAVSGTWDAIEKGTKVSETEPLPIMPVKDNAFYGRFPRIDLSEFLKPALADADGSVAKTDEEKKNEPQPWEIFNAVFFEELKRKIEHGITPEFFSRRIVILPRTTEGERAEGLDPISTLFDAGVDTHELGHHIVSSLAHNHLFQNRLLDEVFADYLSFAVSNNPKIGEHFARASGEIARRLGERSKLTEEESLLKAKFELLAAKGVLRDFAKPATIETIDRHERLGNPLANAYDGGHPARSFLFETRELLNPSEREKFDEITLDVIRQLGHAPKTVASVNGTTVLMRHVKAMMVEMTVRKEERDKLWASQDPRVEAILDEAMIQLRADQKEMAKLEKFRGEPEKFQKELRRRGRRRALKLVGANGFNIETQAWLATRARLETMEREHVARRGFLEWESPRPSTYADYSTPEMLRAYFRAAQRHAPELVDRILERAGHTMAATPVRLPMGDGSEEVVFVRNVASPQFEWARAELQTRLESLRQLREEITELRQRKPHPEKELKAKVDEYDRALEGVQEFERTNSWIKLKFPNPGAQLARVGFAALNSMAEKQKAETAAAAAKTGAESTSAACAGPLTAP